MTEQEVDEFMDSLAELPVEDQVREMRALIKQLWATDVSALFDNERFTAWVVANKYAIMSMSHEGGTDEQ